MADARNNYFPKMTLFEAVKIAKEGMGTLDRLYQKAKQLKISAEKALAYCLKQSNGRTNIIGDWLDYLGEAKKIGLDLTRETNYFPKDLYTMKSNISQQIKYLHDKEIEEKMKAMIAARNELFSWKSKTYFIRPAESAEELVAEGKALHHCVGGYAERHAKGETTILFIRKNENPDTPFVTMEVQKNGKGEWYVVQIHGYMNDRVYPLPEDVKELAASFMEIVNKRAVQKEKKVRIKVA